MKENLFKLFRNYTGWREGTMFLFQIPIAYWMIRRSNWRLHRRLFSYLKWIVYKLGIITQWGRLMLKLHARANYSHSSLIRLPMDNGERERKYILNWRVYLRGKKLQNCVHSFQLENTHCSSHWPSHKRRQGIFVLYFGTNVEILEIPYTWLILPCMRLSYPPWK
jgi:hypothetical protein